MDTWESYNGWSAFEREHVEEPYLAAIRAKLQEGDTILSVGCGTGYPEFLLKDEATLLGIDTHELSVQAARSLHINARVHDAYNLESLDIDPVDIVLATFFVHNTPRERMTELYGNFASVLKDNGWLITLDPRHVSSRSRFDDCSYIIPIDGDGREISKPPSGADLRARIYLDAGTDNQSVIEHDNAPYADFLVAMQATGFDNRYLEFHGPQTTEIGHRLGYRIVFAQKLASPGCMPKG